MHALTTTGGTPQLGRSVQPRALGRWSHRNFAALKPETLAGILRRLEEGELEEWVDLTGYMLRTDPHLRSVYLTLIQPVAGAAWKVTPGRARPGGEADAELAAELCRRQLEDTEECERLFADLLHGVGVGVALAEHVWQRKNGLWLSSPQWLHSRETKFDADWTVLVRGGDDNGYIRTADHPGKFIVHLPRNLSDSPNLTGELLSVAWLWLFKRWCEKFRLTGLERFANPLMYGEVPGDSTGTVRAQLLSDLEQLSADQVAVFETGTQIKVVEISQKAGEAWTDAIRHLEEQYTIGMLGSLDNVSADGGSYARAESQGAQTILPRHIANSKKLAGTIERDWFRPLLRFNAHLFSSVPACPKLEICLEAEEKPEVDELAVNAGAVTIDELRASRGLEVWGPEKGGDRIVTVAKPEPAYSPAFGGEPTASPLSRSKARQMPLPLTTRATTLQTSSASRVNPLALALKSLSEDPES